MRIKNRILFFAALIFAASVFSTNTASAAEKKKAFVISHFHFDAVWTNTQAGETLRGLSAVNQMLEYAQTEPRYKFILSETDYLKPYWDVYPQRRGTLLQFLRDGRAEITGGYNEPDEAAIGGEALIRNFVYGKRFKESLFETSVPTVTQYDIYGHSVQLPRILTGTGYKYAVYMRGNLTDMPSEFLWLGADGSTMLTKQRPYPGTTTDATLHAGDDKYYDLTNNAMFTSGDDFKEPDRTISAQLKKTKSFEILCGTNKDFFEAIEAGIKEKNILPPQISRDQTFVFEGCYSSRIETKYANRFIETRLPDAEKFATILSVKTGATYPWLEFDRAWRLLFFGQHHDAIPGTQNENVNLDLQTAWREASIIAAKQLGAATYGIAALIDTKSAAPKKGAPSPLVIFNSLNWNRTEPVEVKISFVRPVKAFRITDSNGAAVPFQLLSPAQKQYSEATVMLLAPDVPSLGYRVLYVSAADSFPAGALPKIEKGTSLENDFYRIAVDPARGGGMTSLFSKKLNKEFIDTTYGNGNEIIALEEKEGAMSDVIMTNGNFFRSGDYPAESVRIERGAVFDKLIVTTTAVRIAPETRYKNEPAGGNKEVLPRTVKEIILYKKYPRIDFRTHFIDFSGRDFLHKVAFPAALPNAAPIYEDRFASVSRERNNVLYIDRKGDGVELNREYPAFNWLALSPSTAINFIGADEKTVSQYPLLAGEIVLPKGDSDALRNANTLAAALVKTGVTTTPTYDDSARTNSYYGFRISLGYAGNNKYSQKLIGAMSKKTYDFLANDIASKGYGAMFVESSDSFAAGTPTRPIPILIVEAVSRDKLEIAVHALGEDLDARKGIFLPQSANETHFREMMPTAGLALINTGNPGASVELPNTMTISLMRSASGWPNEKIKGFNWILERWNHRYRYSLLPFSGSWDNAGVAREGYNSNSPLISVQTSLHNGPLPGGAHSFLDTGGAGVIVTALKPAGEPIAEGKSEIGGGKDVIVRMYNPSIDTNSAEIKLDIPVASVSEADFLDRPIQKLDTKANSFHAGLAAFDVREYLVTLEGRKYFVPSKTAVATTAPPHYVRYYETNENIAPEGMMPLAVTIEAGNYSSDRRSLDVLVRVASNIRDATVSDTVGFELPPGAAIKGDTKYSLKPMEVKKLELRVTGLDPAKLSSQFIAAQVKYGGRTYEDVLTFANWKVFRGDPPGAAKPDTNISAWETVPLSRFWSSLDNRPGTTWYRREFFVAKDNNDITMLFERPRDSVTEIYVNGVLARTEKWGRSYRPRIEKEMVNLGATNTIVIKYTKKEDNGEPAWCTAFRGSEDRYNRDWIKLNPGRELKVKRGGKASFTVEISNPFAQQAAGQALLASPIETWGEAGGYSMIDISPLERDFSAAPSGKAKMAFEVSVPPDALPGTFPAAVKVVLKGTTVYSDTLIIKVE